MKILIIEDEVLAAEYLEKMINDNLPDCQVVGKASTVREASKMYNKLKPDLLIMDINLGDHLSFELFEYIDASQLHVVFTTGYNEYALKAIKANAIDYVVKPINQEDLVRAVSKARTRIHIKDLNMHNTFMNKEKEMQGMILVWENDKLIPVRICELVKVKADGSYSRLYMVDGRKIHTSKNLGVYDAMLESRGFIRIHHKCLINSLHLASYKPGVRAYVTMSDNVCEYVSKNKKKALMKVMKSPSL